MYFNGFHKLTESKITVHLYLCKKKKWKDVIKSIPLILFQVLSSQFKLGQIVNPVSWDDNPQKWTLNPFWCSTPTPCPLPHLSPISSWQTTHPHPTPHPPTHAFHPLHPLFSNLPPTCASLSSTRPTLAHMVLDDWLSCLIQVYYGNHDSVARQRLFFHPTN